MWYQQQPVTSGTPIKCIFLHGVGNADVGAPSLRATAYWDKIEAYTKKCSERHFIRADTVYKGWNNTSLQQEYCNLVLIGEPDKVARNKVIFAHSMGNMILAGAIKNGLCSLDSSTFWYDTQGPINGSVFANFVEECVCPTGRSFGFCNSTTKTLYPAFVTLKPGYDLEMLCVTLLEHPGVSELAAIARQYVTGVMCGTSPIPLFPSLTSSSSSRIFVPYSLDMFGFALFVYEGADYLSGGCVSQATNILPSSDVAVPLSSCVAALPQGKNFSTSYKDNFYLASVSHLDGTCRNGDGWWGKHRKPCSWFAERPFPQVRDQNSPQSSSQLLRSSFFLIILILL